MMDEMDRVAALGAASLLALTATAAGCRGRAACPPPLAMSVAPTAPAPATSLPISSDPAEPTPRPLRRCFPAERSHAVHLIHHTRPGSRLAVSDAVPPSCRAGLVSRSL